MVKHFQRLLKHSEAGIEARFDIEVPEKENRGAHCLILPYVRDLTEKVGPFSQTSLYGESGYLLMRSENPDAKTNQRVAIFTAESQIPEGEGIRGFELRLRINRAYADEQKKLVVYEGHLRADGDIERAKKAYEIFGAERISV